MKRILFTISLILLSLAALKGEPNRMAGPWVFTGYRSLTRQWLPDTIARPDAKIWRNADMEIKRLEKIKTDSIERARADSLYKAFPLDYPDPATIVIDQISFDDAIPSYQPPFDPENPIGNALPDWLHDAIQLRNIQDDFMYGLMVVQPKYIEYAEWDLPEPPTLPAEDRSFLGYLKSLNLPKVNIKEADMEPVGEIRHINWLHTLNFALQLSQAYISPNWYQGGNDYLAFFGNFLWDVQLNQVYYPNQLLQSTLSYKLAITSSEQDTHHKYSVSQELFQYNFKYGYKAAHNWFYSFTTQFKTQFLHAYAANSDRRLAAFLSPGQLNIGLGMTYNWSKPDKISFSASIAPLSYNLKTCIDDLVDHAQLGMKPGQKVLNEYGSNAEVNFQWQMRDNISYKTRLFLFTDYKNFNSDWENTFNFQFNKYFSTQLYLYFRYDSATDASISRTWKKWMLKEILSVGISYTFATK